MISEREYRMSKKMVIVCGIILALSIFMLCVVLYGMIVYGAPASQMPLALINIALMAFLTYRHRKTIKAYEKENGGKQ